MTAVSYVTELANSVTIGNEISAISAPAFVKKNIGMNHMHTENLPTQTNVKKFKKDGSMSLAALTGESNPAALAAGGEYTESSVTSTAAKAAITSGLSVEEQKFGTINLERLGNEQFGAIARYVDNDWLSEFANLSTTITATSVLTIDDVMQGQLAIYNANCPNQEVTLSAILGPTAVYNLKKEIVTSGAATWSNMANLSLLADMTIAQNGFVGNIPGVCDVYQTTGFSTSGGDDVQAIVHPMWCHAGMFDAAPTSWMIPKGSEGFYTELASYYFYDVVEWNDLAGAALLSNS